MQLRNDAIAVLSEPIHLVKSRANRRCGIYGTLEKFFSTRRSLAISKTSLLRIGHAILLRTGYQKQTEAIASICWARQTDVKEIDLYSTEPFSPNRFAHIRQRSAVAVIGLIAGNGSMIDANCSKRRHIDSRIWREAIQKVLDQLLMTLSLPAMPEQEATK